MIVLGMTTTVMEWRAATGLFRAEHTA